MLGHIGLPQAAGFPLPRNLYELVEKLSFA
jgi:hypothetical protein